MNVNNTVNRIVSYNDPNPLEYLHQVFASQFPSIKLTPVSTNEIREIINSLKWKNSHGYDEIPIKILKTSLLYTESPLTYICNKMLPTGIFPT